MGYCEFRDYLNSHVPNKIGYFSLDYEDDYTGDNTYITVTIHYSYNSTYDDWSDYSYAISRARSVIYDAIHYGSTHPYSTSGLHLDRIVESNDYDDD